MAAARRQVRLLFCRLFFTHGIQQHKSSVLSFDNPEVKSILKKITGRNLDKIYAPRKQALVPPSYKLLTDTEFLEVISSLATRSVSTPLDGILDQLVEQHHYCKGYGLKSSLARLFLECMTSKILVMLGMQ